LSFDLFTFFLDFIIRSFLHLVLHSRSRRLNELVERVWPLAVFKPPVLLFWSAPSPVAITTQGIVVEQWAEFLLNPFLGESERPAIPQATEMAAHRKSDRLRDDPYEGGLRKRASNGYNLDAAACYLYLLVQMPVW
jgi:hypothetical protein